MTVRRVQRFGGLGIRQPLRQDAEICCCQVQLVGAPPRVPRDGIIESGLVLPVTGAGDLVSGCRGMGLILRQRGAVKTGRATVGGNAWVLVCPCQYHGIAEMVK